MRQLRTAVADLKREAPKRHLWFRRHFDQHELSAAEQHELDVTIDWLAERMPEPDLYHAAADRISWVGDREEAIAELGEAVVEEMRVAWHQAVERLEDEWSDEDVADDPDAPPAPVPVTVILPRKSSGRVSPHPCRGTPQHKDAREGWRAGSGRRRPDESFILDWAYGDGGDEGTPR